MQKPHLTAFTLIELIIVIALIAILAAAVFVAIDPATRFAQARNVERQQSTESILKAIKLYQSDNENLPPSIDTTLRVIGTAITGCDLFCGGTETPAIYIDDAQPEFDAGTYLDTQWDTNHIELDSTGMNNGTGTYLSQVFDSAREETSWNTIGWTEKTDPTGEFRMEVGSTATNNNFTTVNLNQSYLHPVVITLYHESANSAPASVRLRNVSSSSFEVALQHPAGNSLSSDNIHYLVIEEGAHTLPDGTKLEAHTISSSTIGYKNNWTATNQSYSHTYSSNPLVLHQIQTYNDTGWIETWISRQNSSSNPPNTTGFQIAMNGAEAVTTHAAETLGWVAIETGTGTINGINFEAAITPDTIQGHQNGCYSRSFSNTYSSSPLVLADQLEMDGSDGSWGVGCALSSSTIGMHAEEDQQNDSERNHTSETFGFLAFAEAFSANSLDMTFQLRSCDDPVCTDELFTGPDGTTSTYYSSPSGENLIAPDNQYFQYRANLTTSDPSFSPELSSVNIGYTGITGGETAATACLDLSSTIDYYLPSIPTDPKKGSTANTYYAVKKVNALGEIQVIACSTELNESIMAVR